jgi:hypothetical protein
MLEDAALFSVYRRTMLNALRPVARENKISSVALESACGSILSSIFSQFPIEERRAAVDAFVATLHASVGLDA